MKIPMFLILIHFSYFTLATSDNCFKSLCIPSGYDKTMKPKFRLINETEEYYDYYSYETERLNLSETFLENHN